MVYRRAVDVGVGEGNHRIADRSRLHLDRIELGRGRGAGIVAAACRERKTKGEDGGEARHASVLVARRKLVEKGGKAGAKRGVDLGEPGVDAECGEAGDRILGDAARHDAPEMRRGTAGRRVGKEGVGTGRSRGEADY